MGGPALSGLGVSLTSSLPPLQAVFTPYNFNRLTETTFQQKVMFCTCCVNAKTLGGLECVCPPCPSQLTIPASALATSNVWTSIVNISLSSLPAAYTPGGRLYIEGTVVLSSSAPSTSHFRSPNPARIIADQEGFTEGKRFVLDVGLIAGLTVSFGCVIIAGVAWWVWRKRLATEATELAEMRRRVDTQGYAAMNDHGAGVHVSAGDSGLRSRSSRVAYLQ